MNDKGLSLPQTKYFSKFVLLITIVMLLLNSASNLVLQNDILLADENVPLSDENYVHILKSGGGEGHGDQLEKQIFDSEGNTYVLGKFGSWGWLGNHLFNNSDGTNGNSFIAKYLLNGSIDWIIDLGTSARFFDFSISQSDTITAVGEVYTNLTINNFTYLNEGNKSGFIAIISTSGELLTSQIFNNEPSFSLDSSSAQLVCHDSIGNSYVSGIYSGRISPTTVSNEVTSQGFDIFVMKYGIYGFIESIESSEGGSISSLILNGLECDNDGAWIVGVILEGNISFGDHSINTSHDQNYSHIPLGAFILHYSSEGYWNLLSKIIIDGVGQVEIFDILLLDNKSVIITGRMQRMYPSNPAFFNDTYQFGTFEINGLSCNTFTGFISEDGIWTNVKTNECTILSQVIPNSVTQHPDGSILAAIKYYGNTSWYDKPLPIKTNSAIIILKINDENIIEKYWLAEFSGPLETNPSGLPISIEVSNDGMISVVGKFTYNMSVKNQTKVAFGLDRNVDFFLWQFYPDKDGDGVPNYLDNCNLTENPNQSDYDGDDIGDSCDEDNDNDGIIDFNDSCPRGTLNWTSIQSTDHDRDGCQDSTEDDDDDDDSIVDISDYCTRGNIDWISNNSSDHDRDGCQDSTEDDDDDDDGIVDISDYCTRGNIDWISNNSSDHDGDGCQDSTEDDDDDNDELIDLRDLCPIGIVNWTINSNSDNDFDGCRDSDEDDDDDNDDWLDEFDACIFDSGTSTEANYLGCPDIDQDGWADLIDLFPLNYYQWNDSDGDSWGDNWWNTSWNDSRQDGIGLWIEGEFRADRCPYEPVDSMKSLDGCKHHTNATLEYETTSTIQDGLLLFSSMASLFLVLIFFNKKFLRNQS